MKSFFRILTATSLAVCLFATTAFAAASVNNTTRAASEVVAGDTVEALKFQLQIDSETEIDFLHFQAEGNGWREIGNVSLLSEDDDVLGKGRLDVDGKIVFHLNYLLEATEEFRLLVSTDREAQRGKSFQMKLTEIAARDLEEEPVNVEVSLPLSGNNLVFVDGALDGVAQIEVEPLRDLLPNELLVARDTLKMVFVFEIKADRKVTLDEMTLGIIGDLKNRTESLEVYLANGEKLITAGANLIVREDVDIDEDGVRFYVFMKVNDQARRTHKGQIVLEDLTFEEPVEGEGVPLYSDVFEVTEAELDSDDPNDLQLEEDPVEEEDDEEEEEEEPVEDTVEEPVRENPFSDVDFGRGIGAQAAVDLAARGMIGGYLIAGQNKSEFRGENNLNRAEAVKFIINSMVLAEGNLCDDRDFPDAPRGRWYSKYVCSAIEREIIQGYVDGKFRPANLVTKAEFLKMLAVAHDLELNLDYDYPDVHEDDWFAQYAGVSQKLELFPDEGMNFDPHKILNRWETAIAVYKVLQI